MNTIEKLLTLQEYDLKLRGIQRELHDIPQKKEEETTRLSDHEKAVENAQQKLKAVQADLKNLELEANAKEEAVVKLRQQQMEIKTNKEFKAMEGEIGAVEETIRSLEDQELALMEQLESAREEVKVRRVALEEQREIVQSDIDSLDARAKDVALRIEEIQKKRDETAAGIEEDWRKHYERLFERKDKALVPIENGVCGGCHMKLPRYLVHDAHKRTSMVSCNFCGRLLY